MARVEIERQISFFSFGFARVSEVRHMHNSPNNEDANVSEKMLPFVQDRV